MGYYCPGGKRGTFSYTKGIGSSKKAKASRGSRATSGRLGGSGASLRTLRRGENREIRSAYKGRQEGGTVGGKKAKVGGLVLTGRWDGVGGYY